MGEISNTRGWRCQYFIHVFKRRNTRKAFCSRLCPSGSFMNGLGCDSREIGHKRVPAPPERIIGISIVRYCTWRGLQSIINVLSLFNRHLCTENHLTPSTRHLARSEKCHAAPVASHWISMFSVAGSPWESAGTASSSRYGSPWERRKSSSRVSRLNRGMGQANGLTMRKRPSISWLFCISSE